MGAMAAKLSEDYPIDALALEVDRRAKKLGRRYSYGMLIADTTPQERQEISEKYKRRKLRSGETEKYHRSSDKEDVRKLKEKIAARSDDKPAGE